jgi:DNA-binding NtrC family response regulator
MGALQKASRIDLGAQAQVLVVDDDFNVARAMQTVLSHEGYEVDTTPTGRGALARFQGKNYDLLVADLRLPDIDGMDVIKKVKTEHPDTAVVIITGFSTVSSAVQAMKLGVSDYLAKPVTDEELKTIVASALTEKKEDLGKEIRPGNGESRSGKLIEKREVLKVLNRTLQDEQFRISLNETGTEALKEYRLTSEAKTAIVSGDLRWLKENVGEIAREQLIVIRKRAECESG